MRRTGFFIMFLAAAAGCGVHLGDKYGRRTRGAFDAQINGRNEGAYPIDGEDAKVASAKHHSRPGTAGAAASGGSGSSSMFGGGGGSGQQVTPVLITPTPTSPIRLDAK